MRTCSPPPEPGRRRRPGARGQAGPLTLSDLQIRATRGCHRRRLSDIANAGKTADRLLSIDCACADRP